MKNKNCFFQQPQNQRSRELPPHARNPIELSLQQAKLDHVFEEEASTYNNLLCRAFWGTSYHQIHKSPILGFSLPRSSEPEKYVIPRTSYVLNNERCLDLPGLADNYYVKPICWANAAYVYIGLESNLYSYDVTEPGLSATVRD